MGLSCLQLVASVHEAVPSYMYVVNIFSSPVQGVGRRYANLVCKKADIDMNKRAGELTEEEVRLCTCSSPWRNTI